MNKRTGTVKINQGGRRGGGSTTKMIQPMGKSGGGVRPTKAGTKGPLRGGQSTMGAGGPHWDHLPGANSKASATHNKTHNPKAPPSTKPGPTWAHLPATPQATGTKG